MPSPVCGYRERNTGWSGRQKNKVTSAVEADSAFVRDRLKAVGVLTLE